MAEVPTLNSVLDQNRSLLEAGASLHWLHSFDYVDENGYKRGKTPRSSKWSDEPRYDLEALRARYKSNSNIGIRLGEPSKIGSFYLHLIDLDIRKASTEADAWAALLSIWPDARRFPSVISGSRGASRHIYFLTNEPFRKLKLAKSKTHELVWDDTQKRHISRNDWEIDLMGTGSQAVIPPSLHPDTHLPYEWERALDLSLIEFGMGPIVRSEVVSAWGARVVTNQSYEDDLETLFNNSPLQLDESEIDEVLTLIPNDTEEYDADGNLIRTGAHYDDYIEVGMALHHQYEGSEAGFEKWVAWASRSSKFDLKHARYRWEKSFGDAKNPVRMATLIQKANTNRLKAEHDFETDDFDAAPTTAVAVRPTTDLTQLIGDQPVSRTSLDSLLTGPVVTVVPAEPKPDENWERLLARNEEGELKSNAHNIGLIVANDVRLCGVPAINEFTQDVVVRRTPRRVRKKDRASANPVRNLEGRLWELKDAVNGDIWTDSHDFSVRIMLEAPVTQAGFGIKVSDRDLRAAVDASAQKNSFHPVREKVKGFIWDGTPRAERMFIDHLGSPDTPYHREAALMLLLGAVVRVFEPGHKFDFVPILEGVQGKGKSTWVSILALDWYSELTGDISKKQEMIEVMHGSWILEVGELSTMHKSEVNELKAFVSRTFDKGRPAYGRRVMEYPRQCVFVGSTNDDTYLRDQTGGRRYWPIKCDLEGPIDTTAFAAVVEQIWAEAYAMYLAMRQRYPHGTLPLYIRDPSAAEEALAVQESRRVETGDDILASKIEVWLDTPIDETGFDDLDPETPKVYRMETCTAQIWEEMLGNTTREIDNMSAQKIGRVLRKIGWGPTKHVSQGYEINKKYGRCRVYRRHGSYI